MKKTKLILPIIIIVAMLLVGGIIGSIFYFVQQTALESARGQTKYLHWDDSIMPCATTMVQKINDFPDCKIEKNKWYRCYNY